MNSAPVANAQSVSTAKNTAKVITLTGSDAEGSTLTYALAYRPSHGTLGSVSAAGVVTYTPGRGYVGTDSFTFTVNDGSLTSAPATVSVTVGSSAVRPNAAFETTPTFLTVQFTDKSTGATPMTYLWTFGDRSSSTEQNPVHTYAKAGNYIVTQTVKNAAGFDISIKVITVTEPVVKPVAAFDATPTFLTVRFTDQSTNTPTSWAWDFGDTGTSRDDDPIHTYTKAGSYTVTLTVTNSAGTDTITKTVTVTAPVKPVAAFHSIPTSGPKPLTVHFVDDSTGSGLTYSWDFGDRSTSHDQSPYHKYTRTGSYTVTLTVRNAAGSNTITKINYIKVN
jgi:PKD repeat protein